MIEEQLTDRDREVRRELVLLDEALRRQREQRRRQTRRS